MADLAPGEVPGPGPRVEDKRWGKFKLNPGARYEMEEDPEGRWGSAWYYEDRLIYVHKKFVAIPQEAVTPAADGGVVLDRPPDSS